MHKIFVFIAALFFGSFPLFQERSTIGMKIVLVVNKESNGVSRITALNTFERMPKSELNEKYPGCHFYVGSLKGNFTLVDTDVVPSENASITMYTEKEVFRFGKYTGAKFLSKGDNFNLGNVSSKITSNKKGELKVKVSTK